ncbi:MAG: TlyA family rRNA (cytidine-2'-O)-methyltransferase, partial [Clostridia bacterium]|nr:TlyA family rRNA (cytidine-2'-O)-methyltransferase [Clostridia bacterium]
RVLSPAMFDRTPRFCVMDVSFISQTLILPCVASLLRDGGIYVGLIKPQFEAGRSALDKHGVVKNAKHRRAAVERVLDAAAEQGLGLRGLIRSPIAGGDGNVEYLAYYIKGEQKPQAWQNAVQALFASEGK